ncbi:MAG TPA: hypothetical protein PLD47_10585, partial [Aggregatilineales bacterium]|nr:hypothetical protein [Aggregatilineales bacterium]
KSSTKAQKAFNDYTAYTPVLNSETALSKAQSTAQRLADIQLKETVIDPLVPELKREIKTLSTFVASLRNLEVALRGEYPDVVKLGKTYESLKKIKITARIWLNTKNAA